MQDRWCDAKLDAETAAAASWPSLGAFLGGVVRNKHDFPNRPDGDFRRPGIVNFKALVGPQSQPALASVTRGVLAKRLARTIAEEARQTGAAMQEVEGRLAALAGVLALLVDEMAALDPPATATALLAPEDELRRIAAGAASALSLPAPGGLELAGCGIFESEQLLKRMSRAARKSGLRDCGLLLVGAHTGEVIGLCPRPRSAGGAGDPTSGVGFDGTGSSRPLAAWELVARLASGIAFARKASGEVVTFQADEVQGGSCPRGMVVFEQFEAEDLQGDDVQDRTMWSEKL